MFKLIDRVLEQSCCGGLFDIGINFELNWIEIELGDKTT